MTERRVEGIDEGVHGWDEGPEAIVPGKGTGEKREKELEENLDVC